MNDSRNSSVEMLRSIAPEGVVLMENNGVLPIREGNNKIALYGAGALLTMKGGTGSGDVRVEHVTNIVEALEEAGFVITTKDWLSDYEMRNKESESERFRRMKEEAEQTKDPLMSVFLRNPQVLTDGADIPLLEKKVQDETAIYVISRISGECADRNAVQGDYYLTDAERKHLEALGHNYGKVVVVLNTGGVIDTEFYREIQGLSAMLLISQAGMACGTVLADVLTGKAVPSGKLTTTWAKKYSDYPASEFFRDNSKNDKLYEEGIYVGYRYFDTFGIEPAYEFGYGKSYTEFKWKLLDVRADEQQICLHVEVQNIGTQYAGKEVLQAYVSSPEGELDKPYQELRAFAKTKLLMPGESEVLKLLWKTEEMSSYSERQAAYVLEAGRYLIRIGNSSRNICPVAAVVLDEDVVTQQLKSRLVPEKKLGCESGNLKERAAFPKCHEQYEDCIVCHLNAVQFLSVAEPYSQDKVALERLKKEKVSTQVNYEAVKSGTMTVEELVSNLTVEELAALCVGAGAIGNGAVIGSAAIKVPGAAGETTSVLYEKWKIPTAVLADGPAGLRLILKYQVRNSDNSVVVPPNGFLALTGFEKLAGEQPEEADCHYVEQKTTAVPIGSMLAQTWNPEVVCMVGQIVSAEMKQYGVNLWLAPAMNIHRDPLCGRNFEYYSEDPLVAGICAASMTKGIQSTSGCGVTVKHFAANSQEENRFDQNSVVSERALREIYLKGFERVVKEAEPMMLMTSYNLINGIHTANNRELLIDILRTEWEYKGAVVTDWGTTRNGMRAGFGGKTRSIPDLCIASGNDLIMPGDSADRKEIIDAVENGTLALADLQSCASNLIRTFIRLEL